MKNQMKNKKAEIGTTITWFVGFIIIFFILVCMVSLSMILSKSSAQKDLKSTGYHVYKFSSAEALISLLNQELTCYGEKTEMKSLLKSWAESPSSDTGRWPCIIAESKKFVQENNCKTYFLRIEKGNWRDFLLLESNPINLLQINSFRVIVNPPLDIKKEKPEIFAASAEYFLPSENHIIKINFYCKNDD